MHIPDGFLDPKVWVTTTAVSAAALTKAVAEVRKGLEEHRLMLLSILGAFIFAAQMVNFPVSKGTSGHLLGAALATLMIGPLYSMLILSVVLIVQLLFFYDGGLTSLGANILNMAIIATWVAYLTFRLVAGDAQDRARKTAAVFLSSWLSVVAAALACSIELGLSGKIPFKAVLPAMLGWHALIGIGEGAITIIVSAILSWVLTPQDAGETAEVGGEGA
ncbi:MAG: energy-coupling factor ABC transporter permease [Thermacetogeniaceae bacterium]